MVKHTVKLFISDPRDAFTHSAIRELRRLPGVRVKVLDWPPKSRVRVLVPFAETERGVRYYGFTSIAGFVRRQLEAAVS